MNEKLLNSYKQMRGRGLPSAVAFRIAKCDLETQRRVAELGFKWEETKDGSERAVWDQTGFRLHASILIDDDGWWTRGVEDIGRFDDRWEPGAVRHGNSPRECRWFHPVDPFNRHWCYRRAVSYGRDWWYVGLIVQASRHGVKLAEKPVCGYEYDLEEPASDREIFFTEEALALADEALAEARAKLKALCADMPCTS
ncbi:MAG: hypothetical protein JXR29_05765 [Methylothermaceae bacterium]|nr:hypothetical protein [Methylothermaceae bacterium]